MKKYGRLFFLIGLVFGCGLLLNSWRVTKEGKEAGELNELYERLQRVEQYGESLSYKLLKLLENLQNLSTANNEVTFRNSLAQRSEKTLGINFWPVQPNAFLYLPHLKKHPDSLMPNVLLGQGRDGVSLVFGIPTVYRQKQSYLVNTVSSLLFDLTHEQKEDIIIIVFVAETNTSFVRGMAETIKKSFPDEVKSGLVEVVCPSPYYYPNFNSLKETFGDSKARVKWRTKQNLDYSFLMQYAHTKGSYYIQLEDDIVAKSGYTESIKTYVNQVKQEQWLYLEFSQLGFIGKLFRTSDLPFVVEFFLMFHKDKPIDWLLDHILWVKVCNPEKNSQHCNAEKAKMKRVVKPSLFQHVGLHSSLPGKIQNLKDKDFGKQVLYKAHSNPPAILSTSLKDYQSHSLEKAYLGQDFFWGFTPVKGDYVLFTFTNPQAIKGYLFRSGNIETNGDRFYNTTVEALPNDSAVREQGARGQLSCCRPSTDSFVVIGSFVNGIAEGVIHESLGNLAAIRLLIHSNSDVWVLLSEIFIKV